MNNKISDNWQIASGGIVEADLDQGGKGMRINVMMDEVRIIV